MSREYAPWMDWMKSLGMVLILYGHLAGWAPLAGLPPIYSKQLGVAFFLFTSGYSLSGDTRRPWSVAFNRLFEVYLFGVGLALIMSVLAVAASQPPHLSNYLPYLGGANVVFNYFPANPTTWFVGTYVQIVLLWTLLLRRIRITVPILLLSVAGEVVVRAVLMQTAGPFVAYMLLPNWWTVFLLGCWHRQRDTPPVSFAGPAVGFVAAVAGWTVVSRWIPFEGTFPFMHVAGLENFTGALFVSLLVSLIYFSLTQLMYRAVSSLPGIWPVQFVARNTLIIFLAHMPIFFALDPTLRSWGLSAAERSAIHLAICLPGLAIVSEVIRRTIRPRELRERVMAGFGVLNRQAGGSPIYP